MTDFGGFRWRQMMIALNFLSNYLSAGGGSYIAPLLLVKFCFFSKITNGKIPTAGQSDIRYSRLRR